MKKRYIILPVCDEYEARKSSVAQGFVIRCKSNASYGLSLDFHVLLISGSLKEKEMAQ